MLRDPAGLITGWVSVPESEWSTDDVAMLVQSRMHDRDLGDHGIPMSEATDPANQFAFTTGRRMDWAEKTRLDEIDRFKESNPKANLHGLMFPVRRV